ncbi:unnamed protein product [Amoebophrya sp. A120]|nr:unnamed protein product [Amoebophrya sp. A120]|eukprot:GSA120T00004130001.1
MIDFYQTSFFQTLRQLPLYAALPEGTVVLVPTTPRELQEGDGVNTKEQDRDAEAGKEIDAIRVEAHILQPLKVLSDINGTNGDTQDQRTSALQGKAYLNLLGERVLVASNAITVLPKEAEGDETCNGAGSFKILAEESMFDHDRTLQILVIKGSLVPVTTSTSKAEGKRTDSRLHSPPPLDRDGNDLVLTSKETTHRPDSSLEARLRQSAKNMDFLCLYPDVEESLMQEMHAVVREVVHVPDQIRDVVTDRVEALIAQAATKIYKCLDQKNQQSSLSARGGNGSGHKTGHDVGSRRNRVERFVYDSSLRKKNKGGLQEKSHDQARMSSRVANRVLILNPEKLSSLETAVSFDQVYESISRSVYTVLAPFLFQGFILSSEQMQTKVDSSAEMLLQSPAARNRDLAGSLSPSSTRAPSSQSALQNLVESQFAQLVPKLQGRDRIIAFSLVEERLFDVGRALANLLEGQGQRKKELQQVPPQARRSPSRLAIHPADKLQTFYLLVSKWIPEMVSELQRVSAVEYEARFSDSGKSKPKPLEADDLISLTVLVLLCARLRYLAAHILQCEIHLENARTLPREVEYSFSVVHSAAMFFQQSQTKNATAVAATEARRRSESSVGEFLQLDDEGLE